MEGQHTETGKAPNLERRHKAGPFATGLAELDQAIEGLRPGMIYTFGSRSGEELTDIGTAITRAAVSDGIPVLYFCMSMQKETFRERYLDGLDSRELILCDECAISSERIEKWTEMMYRVHGNGIVIVDDIQLMRHPVPDRRDITYEFTHKIARNIRETARRYGMSFVMLSHMHNGYGCPKADEFIACDELISLSDGVFIADGNRLILAKSPAPVIRITSLHNDKVSEDEAVLGAEQTFLLEKSQAVSWIDTCREMKYGFSFTSCNNPADDSLIGRVTFCSHTFDVRYLMDNLGRYLEISHEIRGLPYGGSAEEYLKRWSANGRWERTGSGLTISYVIPLLDKAFLPIQMKQALLAVSDMESIVKNSQG